MKLRLIYLLFVSLSLYQYAAGLSCEADWNCLSVTEDYNAVSCINGTCRCKYEAGFSGAALENSTCHCDGSIYWGTNGPSCKDCQSPNTIIYHQGIPYCIEPSNCESRTSMESSISQCTAKKQNLADLAIARLRKMYDSAMYPTSLMIVAKIIPVPQDFTPDFNGTARPFGLLFGPTGMAEYYYGLAAGGNPFYKILENGTEVLAMAQFERYTLTITAVNATVLRATVIFHLRELVGNQFVGPIIVNITQQSYSRYNCSGFMNAAVFDSTIDIGPARSFGKTFPFDVNATVAKICQNHDNFCTGSLQQYANYSECVSVISSKKMGIINMMGMADSVDCRRIHGLLVPIDPPHHCEHIGHSLPSGASSTCQDWTIQDLYNPTLFLNLDERMEDPASCAQESYACDALVREYRALYTQ